MQTCGCILHLADLQGPTPKTCENIICVNQPIWPPSQAKAISSNFRTSIELNILQADITAPTLFVKNEEMDYPKP